MKLKNRAIRAGISVFLCILISKLLNLKYPFFVALPSVMPITSSIEETLKAGRNRMLGTIIGAGVGILLSFILPGSPILGGIGIIIILYLCNFIRWGTSASIAGLVFISIIVGIKGENPLNYSLNRISDTMIGILVTIVVNNVIFHKNLADILYKDFKDIACKLSELTREMICLEGKISLMDVLNEIESVKDQFHIYEEEIKLRKASSIRTTELKNILSMLIDTYEHVNIISTMDESCYLLDANSKKFISLFGDNCKKDYCSDKELNIVFNYHVEHILDKLIYFKKSLNTN